MLNQYDAVANVAVKDLHRAEEFYEDVIGLEKVLEMDGGFMTFRSGNTTLNVYTSDYAGTNKATAVTWPVDDVEDTVKELKAKGVKFEHYKLPGLTVKGDIHVGDGMKVAWFKDPDGNTLSLTQFVRDQDPE